MKERVISGIIGVILAYLFMYYGGFPFFLALLLLMTSGILEFYGMCEKEEIPVLKFWGVFIALLFSLQVYFLNPYSELARNLLSLTLTLSVCGTLIIYLFREASDEAFYGFTATLAGIFYVGWLMTHILLLREIKPLGREFLLAGVITNWAADTGAFYTGMKFGRRRLHKYSPNKTRAGAVGALIGALLVFLVLRKLYGLDRYITLIQAILAGLLIGALAVAGDLSESLFKRNLGIDDSGGFLPGHGGVLDRTDSLLFTVPFVYYFALWVLR
ncbi:MAG: phosphatidate cytidylyltransferase [Elusimicrobia bacterium]|nr:phosphatidate cytidylyltransferase [Elusimicrobiota bacterium]